jgi:photosystem II stability/assembly factor-like uncharacterized protein
MKKIKYIISFLLFLNVNYSIAQWIQKAELANMVAVHFPSQNIGFVVGFNGIIMKSIDSGDNWNQIFTGLNFEFNDVYFTNTSVGFAVGSGSLKTIDGGINWSTINNVSGNIKKIYFVTDQIGFLAGTNGIYKTINGGNNWILKTSIPADALSFPTQDTGYLISSNSIYKTNDGGENWILINSNANPGNFSIVTDLFFIDVNKGYFGGYYYGAFTKTLNGGSDWNCVELNCSTDIGVGVKSIYFPSENIGYATCQSLNNNGILKTIDGGITWNSQFINEYFDDIYFTNNNIGYAVGLNGIFKTENGGNLNIKTSIINDLKVYPNPTANIFFIKINDEFSNNFNFELENILGKRIMNINLKSNENTVDLSNYSNGIYFYKIFNSENETIKTGKIIKK